MRGQGQRTCPWLLIPCQVNWGTVWDSDPDTELFPDFVFVSLDKKNAHNEFDRDACLVEYGRNAELCSFLPFLFNMLAVRARIQAGSSLLESRASSAASSSSSSLWWGKRCASQSNDARVGILHLRLSAVAAWRDRSDSV